MFLLSTCAPLKIPLPEDLISLAWWQICAGETLIEGPIQLYANREGESSNGNLQRKD